VRGVWEGKKEKSWISLKTTGWELHAGDYLGTDTEGREQRGGDQVQKLQLGGENEEVLGVRGREGPEQQGEGRVRTLEQEERCEEHENIVSPFMTKN